MRIDVKHLKIFIIFLRLCVGGWRDFSPEVREETMGQVSERERDRGETR